MSTSVAVGMLVLALHASPLAVPQAKGPASHVEMLAGWDDLTPQQRDRALRNYRTYMDLPAEKRRDVDQRYEKWKRLPQNDQDRFRQKHDRYRDQGRLGD